MPRHSVAAIAVVLIAVVLIAALLVVPALVGGPVTLRILYTGDTVGYLEPCG